MIRDRWRYGLDLFNSERFFAAHEVLEDLWREAPCHGALRQHFQGLVQLAVAFHHQSTGNWQGARSVLERAVRNLNGAEESFPELDLENLRVSLARWRDYLAKASPKSAGARPELPKLRLHIQP